jgi:hypothetical protein
MTRLSNLQFPMLESLVNLNGKYMSIEEAQAFDQRPFRSMLVRGYAEYHPRKGSVKGGFSLSKEGRRAWSEFRSTQIFRKNPNLPLTAYFDPTLYRLKQTAGAAKKRVWRSRPPARTSMRAITPTIWIVCGFFRSPKRCCGRG